MPYRPLKRVRTQWMCPWCFAPHAARHYAEDHMDDCSEARGREPEHRLCQESWKTHNDADSACHCLRKNGHDGEHVCHCGAIAT